MTTLALLTVIAAFPAATPRDSNARSIWNLQEYEGRLYAGYGDWNVNVGPIQLVGFDRTGKVVDTTLINEEAVECMRSIDGEFWVPGVDAREDWSLGSVYVRSKGKWEQRRTVPNGIHVFDVREWNGWTFAGCGADGGASLVATQDRGRTWKQILLEKDSFRIWGVCPVGKSLVAFPADAKRGLYVYDGKTVRHNTVDAFPKIEFSAANAQVLHQLEPFRGGALYTVRPKYATKLRAENSARPLFFLKDADQAPERIGAFADKTVTDIIVKGRTAYVMSVEEGSDGYSATVSSTEDLKTWKTVFRANFGAYPYALERIGRDFYVGLANPKATDVNPHSGEIWKVTP